MVIVIGKDYPIGPASMKRVWLSAVEDMPG